MQVRTVIDMIRVDLDGDSSVQVLKIPSLSGLSDTYFLRLQLQDADNDVVSDNVYWLSTSQDMLEWNQTNFFRTPCSSYPRDQ